MAFSTAPETWHAAASKPMPTTTTEMRFTARAYDQDYPPLTSARCRSRLGVPASAKWTLVETFRGFTTTGDVPTQSPLPDFQSRGCNGAWI